MSNSTGSVIGLTSGPVGSTGWSAPPLSGANSEFARIGNGAGRGICSADCTSARPNWAAVYRVLGSGRPARSNTAASCPKSADTGIRRSTRLASVATADSPSNGTLPVTASNSARHSEYTSLLGCTG